MDPYKNLYMYPFFGEKKTDFTPQNFGLGPRLGHLRRNPSQQWHLSRTARPVLFVIVAGWTRQVGHLKDPSDRCHGPSVMATVQASLRHPT